VSARREKRLRALERRVSELEGIAYMGLVPARPLEERERAEVIDALWARLPERGHAPAFSVETARRGLWQRLVDIFRKDD
jgi:hypothetical protein